MSRSEIGSYSLLLCYQWNNGLIPDDEGEIRVIGKMQPRDNLTKILKKFPVKVEGGYQNKRLEEERKKMEAFSDQQRKNVQKRWGQSYHGNTDVIPNAYQIDTSIDHSHSHSQKDKNIMSGYRTDGIKLIEFLNDKAGRKFETNGANLEMVIARLKEGRNERDLRIMVAKKINQWGTDEVMAKFLRPATLFNRTKCAQYLGED